MLLINILYLFAFISPPEIIHDFHISRCEINYNEKAATIEVSINLFIDDLELGLKKEGIDSLYIGTKKEHKDADAFIFQYLQDMLQLQINTNTSPFNFIGKEQSEDLQAIWCYLEIENVNQVDKIAVTDKILLDIFDDQVNVVNVTKNGAVQDYFLFNVGYSNDVVNFK